MEIEIVKRLIRGECKDSGVLVIKFLYNKFPPRTQRTPDNDSYEKAIQIASHCVYALLTLVRIISFELISKEMIAQLYHNISRYCH